MISILQINLDRSVAAHDLVDITVVDKKIDIVLISEPNKNHVVKGGWFMDKNRDSAIKVYNKKIKVYDAGSGEGFVWVAVGDLQIFSVYISPNVPLHRFINFLDGLKVALINSKYNKVIVGGDMNAKSFSWGSTREDDRGTTLAEWSVEMRMEIVNRGDTPTFVRGEYSSLIDVTLSTRNMYTKIVNWRVSDEENMTDHQYIFYDILDMNPERNKENQEIKWKYNEKRKERCQEEIKKKINEECTNPEQCIEMLQNICENIFRKRRGGDCKTPVYWWNQEIAEKRKECHAQRRKMTRMNKQRNATEEGKKATRDNYYTMKRDLREKINVAKKHKWADICNELNNDIWGNGYRIVCKKFKLLPILTLKKEEKLKIAKELFPENEIVNWIREDTKEENIPLFTLDELIEAFQNIKNKKTPGTDGLNGEIIKIFFEIAPNLCLKMFNDLLAAGTFPKIWKTAKLVLLEKGKKEGSDKMTYRPICLLNVMGKTFEYLLKRRIITEMKEKGDLSENQHGFREGRSTLGAMEQVVGLAEEAKKEGKLCAMTLLDVKNAFNSIPWKGIMGEIRRKGISGYLINMIASYLEDRVLMVEEELQIELSCGVPQGSVLSPLLWNIYYDPLLKMEIPAESEIVAYADDVAVVSKGDNKESLEKNINRTVKKIIDWMNDHKLEIAAHKTEVVLLISKRTCNEITVKVDQVRIKSKESAKYLGVYLGKDLSMAEHTRKAVEKAGKTAANLARLMPNIKGPDNEKRNILASVVYSTLLYGAPIWGKITRWKKYVNLLEKVQRRVMLRLARAYRTSATVVLQVITGSLPIELMVEEKIKVYEMKKNKKTVEEEDGRENEEETMRREINESEKSEEDIKQEMIEKWKLKWQMEVNKGQWTKRLIPDIEEWIKRKHGKLTYEISQFLTGHGSFGSYLFKIKKTRNENCIYCRSPKDNPEHAMFQCTRFLEQRRTCIEQIKKTLTPENIIKVMLENESNWNAVEGMIKEIMKIKQDDGNKKDGSRSLT